MHNQDLQGISVTKTRPKAQSYWESSGPFFVVLGNQILTLNNIVSTMKNLTSGDWHTLVSMSSTARRDALRRMSGSVSFSLITAGAWDRY
jgi:threonine/homoserine/homoserine lactone efflux protein